jgi:hypothetical protein
VTVPPRLRSKNLPVITNDPVFRDYGAQVLW